MAVDSLQIAVATASPIRMWTVLGIGLPDIT